MKPDAAAIADAEAVVGASTSRPTQRVVDAYRVLAAAQPYNHLPNLVSKLCSLAVHTTRNRMDRRLALSAEAVSQARGIGHTWFAYPRELVHALTTHATQLQLAGRRPEALPLLEEADRLRHEDYVPGRLYNAGDGHVDWGVALIEDGRHAEAAEVFGRIAESRKDTPRRSEYGLHLIAWTSALEAAQQFDAAVEVHRRLLTVHRDDLASDWAGRRPLIYALVRFAQLLDAAHRPDERSAALDEARSLVRELSEQGESRRHRGTDPAHLPALLESSAGGHEPLAEDGLELPLGCHWWPPDRQARYIHQVGDLMEELCASAPSAIKDPARHAAPVVILYRRILIRECSHRLKYEFMQADLRPRFDTHIELARIVGGESLSRALIDRAQFLALREDYEGAHADFTEGIAVLTP
jgi:tetratricopeptide (TPR) repeat protein